MAAQSVFAEAEPETRFSWASKTESKPSQDRRSMSPSGWLEAYNSKLSGPFEDFKDVLVILGIALLVVHCHICSLYIFSRCPSAVRITSGLPPSSSSAGPHNCLGYQTKRPWWAFSSILFLKLDEKALIYEEPTRKSSKGVGIIII